MHRPWTKETGDIALCIVDVTPFLPKFVLVFWSDGYHTDGRPIDAYCLSAISLVDSDFCAC